MENVSENDALRGVLMLMKETDAKSTFQQRVETLREKEIIAQHWNMDADRPLSRGKLAYMVYQATDFPGGIILTVAGPSQRYCLRELQYRQMMVSGALFMPVSGMEFISVLRRADVYNDTGKVPDLAGDTDEL